MSDENFFKSLNSYLATVPAIKVLGSELLEDGNWWVKFSIDIEHPLAWAVVQELGHVLNYVSLEERLPTIFKPVSPPPYMNGGPKDFLSWVIESSDPNFTPSSAQSGLRAACQDRWATGNNGNTTTELQLISGDWALQVRD